MATTTTMSDTLELEAKHGLGVYKARNLALARGAGTTVWDESGRAYLDLTAAYGVASLGHCHPAVVAAIREQAGKLIDCSGAFGNGERAQLVAELASVLPAGMTRVFLCNSGTEAVEGALKLARLSTKKPGVIACMRGFHGRTMGALSATWDKHYREPFFPLVPGFRHVPYDDLEALERAFAPDVGAVIVEVVQGEGGVRAGSAEFLRGAQELCRTHGALLVVDEVQTGFGRTGTLFAVEHHGLEPDLIALAKGIAGGFPMGAVGVGPRVQGIEAGHHGSTFGGNPLACAAARATLSVLRAERVPERVRELGAHVQRRLSAVKSAKVREVRGLGLLVGVELKEKVAPYVQTLQERGVLALNAGPTVLRLLPALVIAKDELDRGLDAVAEVLG